MSKVLVVGDVRGNFACLAEKVKEINDKSGPFDKLLCVGEFFSVLRTENEELTNGAIQFPIPTYILGPQPPTVGTGSYGLASTLAQNLYYSGRSLIMDTSAELTYVGAGDWTAGPSHSNVEILRLSSRMDCGGDDDEMRFVRESESEAILAAAASEESTRGDELTHLRSEISRLRAENESLRDKSGASSNSQTKKRRDK